MPDIFISYSPEDNQPLQESEEGWIDYFHQHLAMHLSLRVSCFNVKIFRDSQFNRSSRVEGDPLTKDIKEQLEKTLILVCVLSKSYGDSEWCKMERDYFAKLCAQRLGSIMVVGIADIPREDQPQDFANNLICPFFEKKIDGRELFFHPGTPDWEEAVQQVAHFLATMIRKSEMSLSQTSKKPLLFISHAKADWRKDTDRFNQARKKINEIAERLGYDVFWDEDGIPAGTIDWQEKIARELGNAQVFLALSSPNFFKSANCGKEWALFESRCVGTEVPIIQIQWLPAVVPNSLKRFQRIRIDKSRSYENEGYLGVLRAEQEEDERALLTRLEGAMENAKNQNLNALNVNWGQVKPKFGGESWVVY